MKKLVACLFVFALLVFCAGLIYFSSEKRGDDNGSISHDASRMPTVFDGFADSWNRETRLWLEGEKKRVEGELATWEAAGASPNGRHDARTGMLRKELSILQERLEIGDVVRELPLEALPKNLVWEDGREEPDIGDERAVKGGRITLWNSVPFPSTIREFGPESLNFFNHSLYNTVSMKLAALHPETGRPLPGLACAWAVADEGRTVYYKLDSRARYSNGQPVRAKDFLLGMCLRVSDFARDPYWIGRYRETIASITVYGDDVIAVRLAHPVPLAPYMAARDLYAACPSFYARFDASFPQSFQWLAAPTTGGYTVLPGDISFGRSMTMSRVENWWAKDLRFYRNSCNVDRIEHRFIGEESIALELFLQGGIDALTVRKPEIWSGKLESPEWLNGYIERVTLKTEYPCPTYGIYLNTAFPLLGDVATRKGVLHALDMEGVIQSVFRGSFSRLRSHADGYGVLTKPLTPVPYSPESARECFARAGFNRVGDDGILMNAQGDRLSIALTYASFSAMMNSVCEQLRQRALACGLEIRLDGLDSSVCSRKVLEKRHQMALWAEPGLFPFPDLYRIFHSSLARDEKGRIVTHTNNICSLADEQLDSLLAEEKWASDIESLTRVLHAAQQRLDELCVWSPGWKENGVRTAFWGWVRWPESKETDFCPRRIADPLETHLYWIDSEKKRKILDAKRNGELLPMVEREAGGHTARDLQAE